MQPIAPESPFAVPPPPPAVRQSGELTARWNRFFLLSWLFVIASLIAVWVSSRNTGLSTWWLGPETEPRSIFINLLPFAVPVVMCLLAQLAVRHLPLYGVVGALSGAVIAIGDIDRVPGLAVAELSIAGGALLISIASLAGMARGETS